MNPAPVARRSPYQGLIPYAEGDAPFFFGREKETRLIIANMFASPLTLLYGASGVGKSSVLRAGVAHQLRQRDDLIVVPFSAWQSNAASDLVQTIAEYARRTSPADTGSDSKSASPLASSSSLLEYLQTCAAMGRRLMIILDQFEEYFLYHPQADSFADEFPQAVLQEDVPVSFLISIREDSLAKLDRFEGRIPTLFDNYLRVEHLNLEAARAAIEQPIEQYNQQRAAGEQTVSIEPALVTAVLNQVQTGQVIIGEAGRGTLKTEASAAEIETPFLQMVMTRLWDEEVRAGSSVLKLASLDALGGAERIVRTHLDETMGALSLERQNIAAEVFHYLVTPSGTKIAHTIPDLAEYVGRPRSELAPALEELASGDTRILRGVEPPPDQPSEPRYEIFHDVLAAPILDWRRRYRRARELAAQQLKLATLRQRTKRLRLALFGVGLLLLLMTGLTAWYYKAWNYIAERPIDSIAILPFNTVGSDPQFDRLGEGLTKDIINDLSKLPGLRVSSYNSILPYQGRNVGWRTVGPELNVRAILVGRVIRRGNSLILNTELVDTIDGKQVWAMQRPVKLPELFLVDEIVTAISANTGVKLSTEEKLRNSVESHYARGRNALISRTGEAISEAKDHFDEVLRLDPNNALAYAGLADCYNLLGTYGEMSPKEAYPKAHDAALKALALNSTLAEAHAALAYASFRGQWNWNEAEREFKYAISLNGNYAPAHQWYATFLAAQSRFDEAIRESRQARELDRTSLIVQANLALVNYFAHRFDDSVKECLLILEVDPKFIATRRYLGLSYAQKGNYKEALEEFEVALAAPGSSPMLEAEYANTLALLGDTTRAEGELEILLGLSKQNYVSPYHIASVYAGLKDHDRAIEWLEKAFQERADWMAFLKVDPRFDHLHSDPRFKALLHRMNL